MEIKIEKKVEKGIEKTRYYHSDGGTWKESFHGREFTGHTAGWGKEVFQEDPLQEGVAISWGHYEKHFYWDSLEIDETPEERLEKILERIGDVRLWINDCQKEDAMASGSIIGVVGELPELAVQLCKEKRLFFRDNKGKIRKLG